MHRAGAVQQSRLAEGPSREGGRAAGAPRARQHLGSPQDKASCSFYRERVHKHLECRCAKPISALRWSNTLGPRWPVLEGAGWKHCSRLTFGSTAPSAIQGPPRTQNRVCNKNELQLCVSLLGVAVSSSQLIRLHWGAAHGAVPTHTDKVIQWAAPVLGRDSTREQQEKGRGGIFSNPESHPKHHFKSRFIA